MITVLATIGILPSRTLSELTSGSITCSDNCRSGLRHRLIVGRVVDARRWVVIVFCCVFAPKVYFICSLAKWYNVITILATVWILPCWTLGELASISIACFDNGGSCLWKSHRAIWIVDARGWIVAVFCCVFTPKIYFFGGCTKGFYMVTVDATFGVVSSWTLSELASGCVATPDYSWSRSWERLPVVRIIDTWWWVFVILMDVFAAEIYLFCGGSERLYVLVVETCVRHFFHSSIGEIDTLCCG